MSELRPDRILELRKARGLSQTGLGGMIGVSQASVQRMESGETRHARNIMRLAAALATTPEYLTGETDEPAPNAAIDRRLPYGGPPAVQSDTVEVAEIDLRYGLGASYLDDVVESSPRQFSRAWLRHFTDSPPEELFWAKGQGNSMEVTIHESDVVLIDRRQQTPRMADLIWAVAFGEIGMIKRLRPMPDGSVKILSDNPAVPPETAHDGELVIIGRVVAVVKRV